MVWSWLGVRGETTAEPRLARGQHVLGDGLEGVTAGQGYHSEWELAGFTSYWATGREGTSAYMCAEPCILNTSCGLSCPSGFSSTLRRHKSSGAVVTKGHRPG